MAGLKVSTQCLPNNSPKASMVRIHSINLPRRVDIPHTVIRGLPCLKHTTNMAIIHLRHTAKAMDQCLHKVKVTATGYLQAVLTMGNHTGHKSHTGRLFLNSTPTKRRCHILHSTPRFPTSSRICSNRWATAHRNRLGLTNLDHILKVAPKRSRVLIICHRNIRKHRLRVSHLCPTNPFRDRVHKGTMRAAGLILINNPNKEFKLQFQCMVLQPRVILQTIPIKAMHKQESLPHMIQMAFPPMANLRFKNSL